MGKLHQTIKNLFQKRTLWEFVVEYVIPFTLGIIFVIGLHILFLYKTLQIIVENTHPYVQVYAFITGFFLLSRFLIVLFYTDSHSKHIANNKYPSVSIIIAAKNEEDSIRKTILTCLESEYPSVVEIIAIDDGSTDNTYSEMKASEDDGLRFNRTVQVIKFDVNRGKREAMAEGIALAKNEIIVFVDSDSFLNSNAIKVLVEHFIEDERIGAISGNSIVENSNTNLLTKMQSARYSVSFDIFKACESVFGTVTCCPGCFSAYRRTAVLSVVDTWRNQTFFGTKNTFGDDRSLTNAILRDWKVVYCRHAVARTIAPDRYKKFMLQQLRWKKSWIREGSRAATFFWKKNIIASLSFYINLIIPILSPVVVLYAVFIPVIIHFRLPSVFIFGVLSLGFLCSLYAYLVSNNRNWLYIVPFIFMYTVVLVWQMPYALLTIKDTRWGTR